MGSVQFVKKQYRNPAVRSMGIYTVTNFFGKGLSFLLLPLFTNPRYLSPADNGLLSLFSQSIIFITPFINLGVLQSASVDYFKLDKKRFKDFCTTGFVMAIVMAAFSFFTFFLFRGFLFRKFSFPPIFIWAIPLAALMTFCYELVILLIRNRNDAPTYMRVNMTRISTELALAVVLIVFLGWGWWGRVTSILVATGCVAIYAIYFLTRNGYLSGSIRKEIIYTELKYSIPIVTLQLSIFCLFSSDSFLLAGITKNNAEVGIYGMACVFGSIILTLAGALIQYMNPKINKALSDEIIDFGEIRKQFIIYISIMTFTFIALLFCVPAVYYLFINNSYSPGIRYYYFLSLGYFFWTIIIFLYSFLLYYKQKKKVFLLAVTSIVISLCSNYFFIKSMSALGASISVCCSYFAVLALTLLFTKNYWRPLFFLKTNKGRPIY
jgi:O-antigen/teichoic acid export membrane protein